MLSRSCVVTCSIIYNNRYTSLYSTLCDRLATLYISTLCRHTFVYLLPPHVRLLFPQFPAYQRDNPLPLKALCALAIRKPQGSAITQTLTRALLVWRGNSCVLLTVSVAVTTFPHKAARLWAIEALEVLPQGTINRELSVWKPYFAEKNRPKDILQETKWTCSIETAASVSVFVFSLQGFFVAVFC